MLPVIQIIWEDSRVIFPALLKSFSISKCGASGKMAGLHVCSTRSTGGSSTNGIGDSKHRAKATGAISGRGIKTAKSAVLGDPRRGGAAASTEFLVDIQVWTSFFRSAVLPPACTWTDLTLLRSAGRRFKISSTLWLNPRDARRRGPNKGYLEAASGIEFKRPAMH